MRGEAAYEGVGIGSWGGFGLKEGEGSSGFWGIFEAFVGICCGLGACKGINGL